MGGIAGPIQQVANTVGQVPQQPGQQPGRPNNFNPRQPGRPQQPGQNPLVNYSNPGQPMMPQMPQQPGQMPIFQRPLPEGFQSPYANYGFDPGLQSYLDNSYLGSMTDGGVNWNYDPTNQTFTGGTMGGSYNPVPLSVMQQSANGTGPGLTSYFQSRFPQPTSPMPTVKPGTFNPFDRPGQPTPHIMPQPFRNPYDPSRWQVGADGQPIRPTILPPQPGRQQPGSPVVQPGPNVFPQQPQRGKADRGLQPATSQGLGGLFKNYGSTPYN